MTSSEGPRLYSLTETARRLDVSRAKLYQLLDSGQLRSVKLGTRRLVTETTLTEFITQLEAE